MPHAGLKKFGKLTPELCSRALSHLPEFRNVKEDCASLLKSLTKDRLSEILTEDYNWTSVYELPLYNHIAFVILAINKLDTFRDIAQSEDPRSSVLDWAESSEEIIGNSDYDGGYKGLFKEQDLIGLSYSLQRTMISVMIHLKSLSALVEDGRNGDDNAFFEAIRLDPAIVSGPSFSDRLAKAVLLNDKKFILRLRSALKGPSGRHWKSYQDVRFVIALLREAGLDSLSDAELEHLFVDQLKIYPKSTTARKNLRMQFWKSKSIIPNGRLR